MNLPRGEHLLGGILGDLASHLETVSWPDQQIAPVAPAPGRARDALAPARQTSQGEHDAVSQESVPRCGPGHHLGAPVGPTQERRAPQRNWRPHLALYVEYALTRADTEEQTSRTSRDRRRRLVLRRTRSGPVETATIRDKGSNVQPRRRPSDQPKRVAFGGAAGSSRSAGGWSYRLIVSFSPLGALHGSHCTRRIMGVDSPNAATRTPPPPRRTRKGEESPCTRAVPLSLQHRPGNGPAGNRPPGRGPGTGRRPPGPRRPMAVTW